MHARTTRGTYRVRNSNHAGGTPPYATQASGLPTRHAHLAAHWVPSVRNTEIGIGPTNWRAEWRERICARERRGPGVMPSEIDRRLPNEARILPGDHLAKQARAEACGVCTAL